jgi:hypothetical protein
VKHGKSRQIFANETSDPHSPRFAEIWITSPGLRALRWLARLRDDAEQTAQR